MDLSEMLKWKVYMHVIPFYFKTEIYFRRFAQVSAWLAYHLQQYNLKAVDLLTTGGIINQQTDNRYALASTQTNTNNSAIISD